MALPVGEERLKRDALAIVQAALNAADARAAVQRSLELEGDLFRIGLDQFSLRDFDRVFSLTIGKAAVPMAAAIEGILGSTLTAGSAVTKHGHAGPALAKTNVFEAGHPVPDEAGLAAAMEVGQLLGGLTARDLLLVAISGGASALLPSPAGEITLAEKQETTRLLLHSGATIIELNQVRKHLSRLKGGQLAALAHPACVVGLLLSDVVGDPIDVIGSGLTAPDPSTFSDATDVLDRYKLWQRVPPSVRHHLASGSAGHWPETPKPGSAIFSRVHNHVIGSNRLALEAGLLRAGELGYHSQILASTVTGEAREVAGVYASILREIRQHGSPLPPPACLLAGGETVVLVRGAGKGGRNQELALAAAPHLVLLDDVLLLSIGTDGTDGPTDAAGALVTGSTISRAFSLGLDASVHLAANDAYPFFDALGDLIRTGPTGTNVMDIQVLLVA